MLPSSRKPDPDPGKYDVDPGYDLLQGALRWPRPHQHPRRSGEGGWNGEERHVSPRLDWSTLHLQLQLLVLGQFQLWLLPELGPRTRLRQDLWLWCYRCRWGHWGAAVGRLVWDREAELHLHCMCWMSAEGPATLHIRKSLKMCSSYARLVSVCFSILYRADNDANTPAGMSWWYRSSPMTSHL